MSKNGEALRLKWNSDGRPPDGPKNRSRSRFLELEAALIKIQEDKDMLWRVQTAQADAIKLIPRIWLEEIEKAIAQNPNRRRQPTMVPVREE